MKNLRYAKGLGTRAVNTKRMAPHNMMLAVMREPHLRPITSPRAPNTSIPAGSKHGKGRKGGKGRGRGAAPLTKRQVT